MWFSPRLPHVSECYSLSSKWSDQNLRFILYFSFLFLYFIFNPLAHLIDSMFNFPWIYPFLPLLPPSPWFKPLSFLAWRTRKISKIFSSYPHSCLHFLQRSQSDLQKNTSDLMPLLFKALQELLIILGIKSKALAWLKFMHTLIFIDLSPLFFNTHLLDHFIPAMLSSCYFSNTLRFSLKALILAVSSV